jgi:hypothetical protein
VDFARSLLGNRVGWLSTEVALVVPAIGAPDCVTAEAAELLAEKQGIRGRLTNLNLILSYCN